MEWRLEDLRKRACRAALRAGLSESDGDDVLQDALARVLARSGQDAAEDEVTREIQRAADRRRPRPRAPPRQKMQGRRVPILCPRFVALASYAGDRKTYLDRVRRVTERISHQPAVLRPGQLHAYLLAYEDGKSVDEIAESLGVRSRHAVVERLRRISKRLEAELHARLAVRLPAVFRKRLRSWLRGRGREAERHRTVRRAQEPSPSVSGCLESLSAVVAQALEDVTRE